MLNKRFTTVSLARFVSSVLSVLLILTLCACQTPDEPPENQTVNIDNYSVKQVTNLERSDVDKNTTISSWLDACDKYTLERSYILTHTSKKDGNTCHSFLIYRKNADSNVSLSLDVTEEDSYTSLNVRFSSDSDGQKNTLTYIEIVNEKETLLSLYLDGEDLDKMINPVTSDISESTWG